MREYRSYRLALRATLLLNVLAIAVCMDTPSGRGRCTGSHLSRSRDLALAGGCGCPFDTSSLLESSRTRSLLTSFLSPVIASSLEEKNTALSLEEKGSPTMGKYGRSEGRAKKATGTLSEAELAYRVQKAQERIELAKRIIQEQEFSSKLEHLKARREMAKRSRAPQ
jgi:hypothetical protein